MKIIKMLWRAIYRVCSNL